CLPTIQVHDVYKWTYLCLCGDNRTNGEGATDCCQWERVECSNTTGRVIALDLIDTYWGEHSWYLNASLFTPFQQLESLDLYGNNIAGFVENEGIERLSRLNNLKVLDLSENSFNNSILSSLTRLSSLRSLNLYGNRLEGSIDVKELHNFTNLEYLKLDDSSLHLSLLQSIASLFPSLKNLSMIGCEVNGLVRGQGFPHFKSLEHLDMAYVRIAHNTSFLQIIGESMPSLKYLSLSYSNLSTNSSRILDQGLCSLMHLQVLYIDNNDLRGSLPWCLANMTSLRILDVSSNQLTGSISSSPLVHLTSIEELYLSDNHFRIPISLEPLFNHSRLKLFNAKNNEINAEITESHSLTTPKFQLSGLSLSSGYEDGVTFPKFLYHQHDLEYVHLSHIKMNGEFPTWLLENNTNLESLFLVNDSLAGPFRLPIHSHKRLRLLDISNNNFRGHIPVEIGDVLPSLYVFNNSMNALDGSIPSSFGNMKVLQILDLSNNHLTGNVEKQIHEIFEFTTKNIVYIYQGKVRSLLSGLDLSCNKLIGDIPPQIGNLTRIQTLNLSHNNLTGSIPSTFSNLKHIESLDLSYNKLNGKIPHQLVELKTLETILFQQDFVIEIN
ncbi:hypothetical protein CUMW_149470, partial [Citrus unshiu]